MTIPVSFKLAKLLKEKGYDKKCYKYFHSNFGEEYEYTLKGNDGELCTNWNIEKDYPQDFISAPTIAEIVMWLYEKHRIWIECKCPILYHNKWYSLVIKVNVSTDYEYCSEEYLTPTEAYEAGIKYILNNLI